MMRPRIMRIALFAVVLCGCGFVGFKLAGPQTLGASDIGGSAGPDAAAVSSSDELASLLVDAASLGPAWAPTAAPSPTQSPLCPARAAMAIASTNRVSVAFTNATGTAMLAQTLRVYDQADAERVMDALRDQTNRCQKFTDAQTSYELTEFTQPALGDEAVAFQVRALGGPPVVADLVFVRSQQTVIAMSQMSASGPSVAVTEDFVRRCLEKFGMKMPK